MASKNKILDLFEEVFGIYGYESHRFDDEINCFIEDSEWIFIPVETKIDYRVLSSIHSKYEGNMVVISVLDFSEGAYELSKELDVHLWDRQKLEREIGKAVLCEMGIDASLDISTPNRFSLIEMPYKRENNQFHNNKHVDESMNSSKEGTSNTKTKDFTENKKDSIKSDSGFDFDLEERLSSSKSQSNDVKNNTTELEEKSSKKNTREIKAKGPILEPKISNKDALQISGIDNLDSIVLELIPYYIIDFTCKFDREGESIDDDGEYFINATTKEFGEVPDAQLTESIEIDSVVSVDISSPTLTEDEMYSKVKEKIKETYTINKKSSEMKRESIIFDQKEIYPKSDEIDIIDYKLVFHPVWNIRGDTNKIKIDSIDGSIISGRVDEGVEFI